MLFLIHLFLLSRDFVPLIISRSPKSLYLSLSLYLTTSLSPSLPLPFLSLSRRLALFLKLTYNLWTVFIKYSLIFFLTSRETYFFFSFYEELFFKSKNNIFSMYNNWLLVQLLFSIFVFHCFTAIVNYMVNTQYMCIRPSVCPSIRPSARLFLYTYVCIWICEKICPSVHI